MRPRSRAAAAAVLLVALPACSVGQGPPGWVAWPEPEPVWDLPLVPGEWVELPPSPLEARGHAGTAWTGRELVIGGGHTYDPQTLGQTCGDGAQCAGPMPVPHDDAAAYDPAADSWRALPELFPVPQSIYGDPSLDVLLDAEAMTWRPEVGTPPIRTLEPGRWIGEQFVTAGWIEGPNGEQDPRKPVAVAVYDAGTGTWRTDPWPFADPHQQELISVWTGTELLLVVRAIGSGCTGGGVCRHLAAWSPDGTWRDVAEWRIAEPPPPGSVERPAEDQAPGVASQFHQLLWDGQRVVGVDASSSWHEGLEFVVLDPRDGSTSPLTTLGEQLGGYPRVLLHGQDLLVVDGPRVAVFGSDDGRWRALPPLPAQRPSNGRAVGLAGDVLVVWGGMADDHPPGSVDEARGWRFGL
ncbi:hypothetical protein CLV92_11112 [Kineococcus xinjiangensis]|uniref:Kelch motif protein n=1 Tax=Kineococcus xinjiangensis TaxID=512762 RepID=A0A2S6IFY3_9ACTN|nr:hypothetical protein [Kineococcus xinjiangensis]PPK93096.1 hypothetical protein CLV92_11112 [Kineococcus xinjiangensis]